MGQRAHRRTNDGNYSGIKQDKFRNSDFESDNREEERFNRFGGVSRATANTINGAWAENRGRRGDMNWREETPFENGKLHNWNRREGWDQYYEPRDREARRYGGSLIHNDYGALNGQRGKGPRGYARPDDRIFDDVCELLTRDRDIDAGQVDVKVENGIVTLTGKVEDRNMKRYAGQIVDHVSGVKDVHNLLEFDRR